ncbi:ABC transporter substrate-binding protein [Cognatitamlana onchidii]|uniref:ABC transporter substrate-binding protein n=1 Tax=Cognatitamlana onchidii TaxID=2562860 RepID=UPI0010A6307E|nr:helical backbone metal receptor [Algibacter onchidii]
MKSLKDQLGRVLMLRAIPKRIISLVPSQTELLCDLGLTSLIVGVTKFCIHPLDIRNRAVVVGGTKQVHLDKIKALKPDIILCNKEENTKEMVEACALFCDVHVSNIYDIEDSKELITQYGDIFERQHTAEKLILLIEREFQDFNKFIANKPALKTAYFIWKNPWMVSANNTFVNYLLQLNKLENVFLDKTRYPEIDLKIESKNRQFDLVLLSSEPYPFKSEHIKEVQAFLPNTPIILVDGEMFSWYGSRLAKAFQYFKALRLSLQNNQSL